MNIKEINLKIFNELITRLKEKNIKLKDLKILSEKFDFNNIESVNNYINLLNIIKKVFNEVLEDFLNYKEEEILINYYTKKDFFTILNKELTKEIKKCLNQY